jgi:hypothetical protein
MHASAVIRVPICVDCRESYIYWPRAGHAPAKHTATSRLLLLLLLPLLLLKLCLERAAAKHPTGLLSCVCPARASTIGAVQNTGHVPGCHRSKLLYMAELPFWCALVSMHPRLMRTHERTRMWFCKPNRLCAAIHVCSESELSPVMLTKHSSRCDGEAAIVRHKSGGFG